MSDFDNLRGRTGFSSKHRTCILMSCLSKDANFALIGVLQLQIVKNLSRGQTVTVQKGTVTVGQQQSECLLMSDFDYLRGRTGFSSKHQTCSLMSCLSKDASFARIRVLQLQIVKNLSRGHTVTVQKGTVTVQVFVDERF